MTQTILITGGTGTQGGLTIRSLLEISKSTSTPVTIHALVRDPESAAAKELAALSDSVKLFQGDFDTIASIEAAAKGASAVFINVSPVLEDWGAELRHGRNIIAASKSAGVRRALYSSVSILGNEATVEAATKLGLTRFPAAYVHSKSTVEKEVQSAGWPDGWSLLRPATFFSNLTGPHAAWMFPELATKGVYKSALNPNLKIDFLDPGDIGLFAATILTGEPAKWNKEIIPLASIAWTADEVAAALTKAVDGRKTIKAESIPKEVAEPLAATNPIIDVQLFQNQVTKPVNLEKVKGYGLPLGTWESFVERNKADVERTVGL